MLLAFQGLLDQLGLQDLLDYLDQMEQQVCLDFRAHLVLQATQDLWVFQGVQGLQGLRVLLVSRV